MAKIAQTRFPDPPEQYDPRAFSELVRQLEQIVLQLNSSYQEDNKNEILRRVNFLQGDGNDQDGVGIALSDLSVNTGSASGGGSLAYNNTTGVFSFVPASVPAAVNNTPAFRAYINSTQEVPNNTTTTVAFDGEEFDTDSKYDTSNYRFTPGAGKYFLFSAVRIDETSNFRAELEIRTSEENAICKGVIVNDNTNTVYTYTIATLSATEYAYVTLYQSSGSNATLQHGSGQSYFGGYKLIGA
jgi:hypothetical protein